MVFFKFYFGGVEAFHLMGLADEHKDEGKQKMDTACRESDPIPCPAIGHSNRCDSSCNKAGPCKEEKKTTKNEQGEFFNPPGSRLMQFCTDDADTGGYKEKQSLPPMSRGGGLCGIRRWQASA